MRLRLFSVCVLFLLACGPVPESGDGGPVAGPADAGFTSGDSGTPLGDADGGFDAGAPDGGAVVTEALGTRCSAGCLGGAQRCTAPGSTCESGVCLFDTTEAYCTADCSARACPEGYRCEVVTGPVTSACVALPAVCGNRVVERGEACDDGNTQSDDGCRGDCQALDTPLSEQYRLGATLTVRGSFVPLDGGVAVSFDDRFEIDAGALSSDPCNTARWFSGNSEWHRYTFAGCTPASGTNRRLDLRITVPGHDTLPSGVTEDLCISLTLPDRSLPPSTFCAPMVNVSLTQLAAPSGRRSLDAVFPATPLDWQPGPSGPGTCQSSGRCPMEFPTRLTVEGTLRLRNEPI